MMVDYLIKQEMLHYLDKKNTLVVLMLFAFQISNAQITSRKDKKMWFEADKAFEYGDYLKAGKMYENLIQLDSNNQEINYNLGISYFFLKKDRLKAIKHLNKVDPKNASELNYYLGRMYHLSRKYEVAISKFNDYKY